MSKTQKLEKEFEGLQQCLVQDDIFTVVSSFADIARRALRHAKLLEQNIKTLKQNMKALKATYQGKVF